MATKPYSAPIGRSSYNIPFDKKEDLPLLKEICQDANQVVNSILALNSNINNENALVLALINIMYEQKELKKGASVQQSLTFDDAKNYTSQDVIQVISYLQKQFHNNAS